MLESWLELVYLRGLSLPAKRLLVEHHGSPRALLAQTSRSLCRTVAEVLPAGRVPDPAALDGSRAMAARMATRDAGALTASGGRFIGFTDDAYPDPLQHIDHPPLGLFVSGNEALLASPQVAIVGSRHGSRSGMDTAARLANDLVAAGITVTSGLAQGIDGSAHRGALAAGGDTVAVVANGIDRYYPWKNRGLQADIRRHGLLVSEFPPGTRPRRGHFPQRNRIISGLSLATVVVEAGLRSGSLITARLAAEQGRDVFAVPGSIHAPGSRGCHYLLRQGAILCESAADILDELGHAEAMVAPLAPTPGTPPLDPDLQRVYTLLEYHPSPLDQIIELSGLTADQVSSILVKLELQGLVLETTGGYQRLPEGRNDRPRPDPI